MTTDKENYDMEYYIDKIDDLGLPRNSYIHAVQEFMARELPKDRYEEIYHTLTNVDRTFPSRKEARLNVGYVIQDIVKAICLKTSFNINETITSSDKRVASLIASHPYVLLEPSQSKESEDPTSVPLSSHSDPTVIPLASHKRPTRGTTKDLINHIWKKMSGKSKKEIIDEMISSGIATGTANTYFYSMKKKFGHNEPTGAPKAKRVSKKDVALELYKTLNDGRPQSEVIAKMAEALDTSSSGVLTYFHMCKREIPFVGSTKSVKKESKKELALRAYKENVGKSKNEIIAAIAAACNSTIAGATTYYYSCKKGL